MNDVTEVLVTEYRADIARYERSMRRLESRIDRTTNRMEKRFRETNQRIAQTTNQMSQDVRRAIAAIALGAGAREVTAYADSWVDLNNKLAAASQVSGIQSQALNEIADDARAARQEVVPYVDLYARLLRAGDQVGATQQEIAKATNLTAKAFKAGGATAQEQAAGILQLGQALGSGFLQGDELRSLRENAPLVAKAIADAMGVSIGQLKALGAEGKLTSDIVFRALLSAEKDIEGAFGVTVPRASDEAVLAFDRLKLRVGEYAQDTGIVADASAAIASAINFVADDVDAFADGLIVAGAAITGALGAQAAAQAVSGLASITTGATATARAMSLLRVSSAFLFGPAGLIIGVGAAASALALFAINGDNAAVASAEYSGAIESLSGAIDTYREAQETVNGLTGQAKIDAEDLAKAKRAEAFATLEAARAKLAEAEAELARRRASEQRRQRAVERGSPNAGEAIGGEFALVRTARDVRLLREEIDRAVSSLGDLDDGVTRIGGKGGFRFFETPAQRPSLTAQTNEGKTGFKDQVGSQATGFIAADAIEMAIKLADEAAEQLQREIDLLSEAEDARDRLLGRNLAVALREYEARRQYIERNIEDETRRTAALRALADEEAEFRRQARDDVLGEGASSDDPVERLRAQEADKLAALAEARELDLINLQEYNDRRREIEEQTEEQIRQVRLASLAVQLQNTEQLFGGLSALAKEFAGEQSGVFKALFIAEKAAAVARSVIAIQSGMAQALANPFPQNLAYAAIVAGQGASILSTIKSAAPNFRDGAVDIRGAGSGRSDSILANISRGETIIDAPGTSRNLNVLRAIHAGADVEAALSSLASRTPALSLSGSPIIVEGNLDTVTLDDLEARLAAANASLLDQARALYAREARLTTARHQRNNLL